MKLRIQGNSIRFRLLQSEVKTLRRGDKLEESIHFGPGEQDRIAYSLELSDSNPLVEARLKGGRISVKIPCHLAIRWSDSADVAIEARQPVGAAGMLEILIEKDFKCLDSDRPENADAFPNPRLDRACD